MTSPEIPAHSLIEEISKLVETQHLVPFGDGPFEVELAEHLKTMAAAEAQAVVDFTTQLLFSRLVSPHADLKDFRIFASFSFVARFAGVPLAGGMTEVYIRTLLEMARKDPAASLTLADYLRTLARTDTFVEVSELPAFDYASDSTELLAAYAELLVAQRGPDSVEVVRALLDREANVSGLLWNLAHEEYFAEELSRAGWALGPQIREEVEAALEVMDPSLEALDRWKAMSLDTADERRGIDRFSPYGCG